MAPRYGLTPTGGIYRMPPPLSGVVFYVLLTWPWPEAVVPDPDMALGHI
jgi:hypothetical protein